MSTIESRTPLAEGRVTDHGAQVVAWRPAGSEPVIWLSRYAVWDPGSAIRGGVPICFPWFGPGRSGQMTPAHGFARTAQWDLESASESEGVTTVVHVLTDKQTSSPRWPFRYRATATVSLGETLRMVLAVENADDRPFSFETALHTYLAVGDAPSIVIEGLEGARFHDKVTGKDAVQVGPLRLAAEVDRVYASPATVEVHDPVLNRTLVIEKSGSASTIIWNPWVEKAQAMTDFGDDEWRSMVCVETANVGDHAVLLAPREVHEMKVTLSVDQSVHH